MKYIFVTGGVVSGLGKGICAASLGRLLKQCGLREPIWAISRETVPMRNIWPHTA